MVLKGPQTLKISRSEARIPSAYHRVYRLTYKNLYVYNCSIVQVVVHCHFNGLGGSRVVFPARIIDMNEMILNYSSVRERFASVLDQVNRDHVPCIVTRKDKPSNVILSEEDYSGMMETLYLLSSPFNALRLVESIGQLNSGQGIEAELLGEEEENLGGERLG